jgi:NTP pyrophosphatase (non-canonical NTP hydrolase)
MIKFEDMVSNLVKPGVDVLNELTPEKAHQVHMVLGISGESGELLDAIKKGAIYNKPLDIENVIEELGDIEFYLEGLRQSLGVTRQETIDANINKLGKRYSAGKYTNNDAQQRADKS